MSDLGSHEGVCQRVHVHVCVYRCPCVCTHVHMCECLHACTRDSMHVHVCLLVCHCVYDYPYVCPCMSMCAHVCVYMYVSAYVCPCMCVSMCIHICPCVSICVCPPVCVRVCVHCVWMDGDPAWGHTGRWQRLHGHWAQPLAFPWGSDQSPISLMWETLVWEEETKGAEKTSSSGGSPSPEVNPTVGRGTPAAGSGSSSHRAIQAHFSLCFQSVWVLLLLLFLPVLENLITLLNVLLLGTSPCFIRRRR